MEITEREDMVGNLRLLVDLITKSHIVRSYLIMKGIEFYSSSLRRGVITIFVTGGEFKKMYDMLCVCVHVISPTSFNSLIGLKMLDLVLYDIDYYTMDDKHLKSSTNIYSFNNYDIDRSCMVYIGIVSEQNNICYTFVDHIT